MESLSMGATKVILLANFAIASSLDGGMLGTSEDLHPFWGSKTPYLLSHKLLREAYRKGLDIPQRSTQCKFEATFQEAAATEVLGFWGVFRHGSRCPTVKRMRAIRRIESMLETEAKREEQTDSDDGEKKKKKGDTKTGFHRSAQNNESLSETECQTEDNAGMLTFKGKQEMFDLGKRLRNRLPSLFSTNDSGYYSPEHFQIRATQKQRALQSASAFTMGLFGGVQQQQQGNLSDNPKSQSVAIDMEDKKVLYFHKTCRRYMEYKARELTNPNSERYKFNATRIAPIVAKVKGRIRLKDAAKESNFTMAELWAAWSGCQFGDRFFCSLFTSEEALLMEYSEDLASYWQKGYGNPLNSQMSCLLMKDLILSLEEASMRNSRREEAEVPLARLYFAHAETLYALLPLLEMYKDPEPLRSQHNLEKIRRKIGDCSFEKHE
eukprot:jgi/Bigna1/67110/fgenesh1_pg.3_\